MPIVRTYACDQCNHMMEVMLSSADWNMEAPECPACAERVMRQEFRPVAITGSPRSKAATLAEDIAANDYQVADMSSRGHGESMKVRYKDQPASAIPASSWTAAAETLELAIAAGRETRLTRWPTGPIGSGLDVLQAALKSGAQPDLIEASKRRAIKIW